MSLVEDFLLRELLLNIYIILVNTSIDFNVQIIHYRTEFFLNLNITFYIY